MLRTGSCFVVCAVLTTGLFAAPPQEEAVQGMYEGIFKDAKGQQKVEARVVALGKNTYKVFLRRQLAEGKTAAAAELDGKAEGDAVTFAGKIDGADWSAAYADAAVKGTTAGGGTLELKRIVRPSPTLGTKPPPGAVVLLDGKNFEEMTKKSDQEWKLVDGGVEMPKGGMNAKRSFDGSFKMHVEFWIPFRPAARGQGRGNSGVYLPNGDEIQVLDSFGMTTYKGGGCGGLYAYKDPDAFDLFSLASLPPLEWQAYDIEYRVAKKDGKPSGKPRVTVLHNGIKIHDNVEVQHNARVGSFHFQDHGNPVRYRNIWVLPLEENK